MKPVTTYDGPNAKAVRAQLTAWTRVPRSEWVEIERAGEEQGLISDELYSAAHTAADTNGRMDDWIAAANIARDIVDAAEVYTLPTVSVYAVATARLAIAAEVLWDVISPELYEQLRALVKTTP